jgi:hypothetical protein
MEHKSITPLLELLRTCTVEEQVELASLAKTTRNYLYQIATQHRCAISALMALRIERAATKMHVKSLGRIPKICMEELALMAEK